MNASSSFPIMAERTGSTVHLSGTVERPHVGDLPLEVTA
jgi:hypothetical protein